LTAMLKRGLMKRMIAGCLLIGLSALPGTRVLASPARVGDTDAVADQVVPPKLPANAKAGSKTNQAAGRKSPIKPTGLAAGVSLLRAPEPLDADLREPARKPTKVGRNLPAAPFPVSTTSPFIPLPPARPVELAKLDRTARPQLGDDMLQTGSIPADPPAVLAKAAVQPGASLPSSKDALDTLISKHAAHYNLPEGLLRRVVQRESGYNPALRHGPFVGLMQMRLATARGVGYRGDAEGLLDANTNLTYGTAYLANAWKVAGGSQDRAIHLYSSGYYYEAKRKGLLPHLVKGSSGR
jgi:soluble lytic murein transglycosylase-like protein